MVAKKNHISAAYQKVLPENHKIKQKPKGKCFSFKSNSPRISQTNESIIELLIEFNAENWFGPKVNSETSIA